MGGPNTTVTGLDLGAEHALLYALLMLRGPQTVNELLTRSERLHRFDDAEEVAWTLERLAQKQPPMVVRLPRRPGQREDRFMHLLCGPVETDHPAAVRSARSESDESTETLAERIEALEARVAALEARDQD